MINKIEILCPPKKCNKCTRMIARVEEAAKRSSAKTEIIIVDSIDQLQTYNSWLLPSLVVNGQMVSRGYIPEINKIQKFFI
ncbi:MAG: thioredoxin family protein [Bacteroidales bacterium]